MKVQYLVTVLDAPDLEVESSFWAGLLGGTVDKDDDWHSIQVDGIGRLAIQLAPDHVAPDWPDGTPPQQLHIDVHVDTLAEAHEKALSLGARVLKPADNPEAPEGFQVYADPSGHPFCLCWG